MRTATFIAVQVISTSLLIQDVYALECPQPIAQISEDWEVEVNAAVARIGPVKGPELQTRTKNATRDLLGKLPDSGRIYLERMMYSAYCSGLRDDKQLSDSEKTDRLRKYNAEVRKAITAYSPVRPESQHKELQKNHKPAAKAPAAPPEGRAGGQVEVTPTAQPSERRVTDNPQVYIPQDVRSMWVFLQNPKNESKEGCTRLADPIKPDVFAQRIGEFIHEAKARNEKLIVTAYSPQREWDGAAREITIGGKRLNPMQSYYCNAGEENYGYGVQW